MTRFSNMLEDLVTRVTDIGGTLLTDKKNQKQTSLADQCKALLSNSGEATGLARSKDILNAYDQLNTESKVDFFRAISDELGVDTDAVTTAYDKWLSDPSLTNARQIHFTSEPKSQELIRRLNLAPGGTSALVAMRSDLLAAMRKDKHLASLDQDFIHLLSSWFNRGFLSLESITWSTSAYILEKIIKYEAVHAIQGWDDLRNRVGAQDRRLYAFFHPALNEDPLIFVEVALVDALPTSISNILSDSRVKTDPKKANTAVFYSISNCQTGLRGISFGSFLIKQVVEQLQLQNRHLKRFITMSPVPSFVKWASTSDDIDDNSKALIAELNQLDCEPLDDFKQKVEKPLLKLVAQYLLNAKHKSGTPYDPVSKFHLGNGARLEKVHLWADMSPQGLKNSWGIMVNYEYDLKDIEKNHEAFLTENKVICSTPVRQHLTH